MQKYYICHADKVLWSHEDFYSPKTRNRSLHGNRQIHHDNLIK